MIQNIIFSFMKDKWPFYYTEKDEEKYKILKRLDFSFVFLFDKN